MTGRVVVPLKRTPQDITVERLPIALGALLKLAGQANTGGEAKRLIQLGQVRMDGVVERRRPGRVA